jgi:hypothetical protein
MPIDPGDIKYVDAAGGIVSTPTHRLELGITITATAGPMRLREFGLVGGDATAVANSGQLINYVIHPRVDLAPGAVLTRRIRLSFRPGGGSALTGDVLQIPAHWLADVPAASVDGVGTKARQALSEQHVTTLGELARLERDQRPSEIAPAKAIELRGKARLALRTAAEVTAVPSLQKLSLRDIMAGDATSLPGAVPPSVIDRLHEQLALLQLTLDARFLAQTTLGDLTRTR